MLRYAEEEASGNAAATCRYYGISRNCYYRWLRRYEDGGLERLKDRSSRPHNSPKATAATWWRRLYVCAASSKAAPTIRVRRMLYASCPAHLRALGPPPVYRCTPLD